METDLYIANFLKNSLFLIVSLFQQIYDVSCAPRSRSTLLVEHRDVTKTGILNTSNRWEYRDSMIKSGRIRELAFLSKAALIATVPYVTFKQLSYGGWCSLHDKHCPAKLHTVDNTSLQRCLQRRSFKSRSTSRCWSTYAIRIRFQTTPSIFSTISSILHYSSCFSLIRR